MNLNVYDAFSNEEVVAISRKKDHAKYVLEQAPFYKCSDVNVVMAGNTIHRIINDLDIGYGPVDFYVPSGAVSFSTQLKNIESCGRTAEIWHPNSHTWPSQWIDENLVGKHIFMTYAWQVEIEKGRTIRYNLHLTNLKSFREILDMQTIYHTAHCYYRYDQNYNHLFMNREAYDLVNRKKIRLNMQTSSARKMAKLLNDEGYTL